MGSRHQFLAYEQRLATVILLVYSRPVTSAIGPPSYNKIAMRFASEPDSLRDIICCKESRGGENSLMNALKFTTTYREVSIYDSNVLLTDEPSGLISH